MVDLQQLVDALMVNFESAEIEVVNARYPSNWRFHRAAFALAAVNYPFEHTHVVAEAGPEEFSVRAFAEPIHVEYERWVGKTFSYFNPMPEIFANVVTAEW